MNLTDEMYREEILELYKNPGNYGSIRNADISYRDYNPVCGDEMEVFVKLGDGKVKDAKFSGKGCAISRAAASKLTGLIKGKKLPEIKRVSSDDMMKLLGIKVSHLRMKCALLALKALQKGMLLYEGRLAKGRG